MSVLFLLIGSAAACLGFPRTAFAGYYKVAYTGGSSSPIGYYADRSMSDRHNSEGFANLGGSSDPGTASCSGAIEANFTWTPSYVGDTSLPPKGVVILESSSVSWGTGVGTQATGSCSDGLGGTPTSYIEESNPSGRQVMYRGSGGSSGNRRTFKKDPPPSFSASCSPQAQASGKYAKADVSYRADIEVKTVSISREGARGETVDADGMTHGDTIYSAEQAWTGYGTGPDGNPEPTLSFDPGLNWQTFHAAHFGPWSSPTWLWSPAYSSATIDWNQWSMIYGGLSYFDGNPRGHITGQTDRIMTYTSTDNDGAEATAQYYIRIHDPVETVNDHRVGFARHVDVRPESDYVVASKDNQVLTAYVEKADTWTEGISAQIGTDIKLVSLSLGFDFSYSYTLNKGMSASDTFKKGMGSYMEGFLIVEDHEGYYNKFDAAGYVGQVQYSLTKPVGAGHGLHVPYEAVGDTTPDPPQP